MDGYQLQITGYEQYLEREKDNISPEVKESIEQNINILKKFVGTTDRDRAMMFNTGAFNDISKEFARRAMINCGIPDKKIQEVMEEYRWLLDTLSAEDLIKS